MWWAAIVAVLAAFVSMAIPMVLDYLADRKQEKEDKSRDDKNDDNNQLFTNSNNDVIVIRVYKIYITRCIKYLQVIFVSTSGN